jgi:tetratricopeptide (TPR) repeat protein
MRIGATPGILLLIVTLASADTRDQAVDLNEEGIRLTANGEFEAAVEVFTRARRLLPADLTLRKNLATAYTHFGTKLLKEKKLEEAVKQYRHAAALEPGVAAYQANLGIGLIRLEQVEEGRRLLEKALGMDPMCAAARAELGTLHYKDGELKEAIEQWEKASVLAPERKDVRDALRRAKREYAVEKDNLTEESAHFLISWDGEKDASVGKRILRILEDAYEKVGADLGIRPEKRVRVTLYTEKDFQAVTGAHAWVGGLFDGQIRIPVKNFASAEREIRSTLLHEYTHVAVHSVTKVCPAWLNEGIAQVFEEKDPRAGNAVVLRAKRNLDLMSFTDLTSAFTRFSEGDKARLAYAQAHSIALHLVEEYGPDRVGRFLAVLGEGKTPDAASEAAFHASLRQLYLAWEGTL